ncbi:alpha/beta hydrolase [Deinococcus piscis]|uniref:Alpha/beta hydrolase n=1 Tax=Deinococcus piscis TaxID=394230 RepID=A0ABQ3KF44_9DEIO|nr:alpha/beta hydrolase [Deinococcus piscis]GHG10736.1 alpha/beta hydrolase [Deinococcus piscis]
MPSQPTYVIIPGYGDSGPGHWQSLWEPQLPSVRVKQDDPEEPWPLPWAARLEEVIAATPGLLVLVAHSCGVPTVLTWAREYSVPERVRGAFLVAPPDAEQPNMPQLYPKVCRMAPVPLDPLPFPALVVSSTDDPVVSPARAEAFAVAWGADLVWAGSGHLNTANGHGEWPEGQALLAGFVAGLKLV